MAKKLRKILSVSGVITNSSTEIYSFYSQDSITTIKNLVNSFIKIRETDLTFDELFEVRIVAENELEDELEEYKKENGLEDEEIDEDDQDFLEWVLDGEDSNDGYPKVYLEINCTELGKTLGYEQVLPYLNQVIPAINREVYC